MSAWSWTSTSTGGNWSTGPWTGSGETYPDLSTDTVTIGSTSNSTAYTITQDVAAGITISSLSITGKSGDKTTLQLEGNALTVANNISIAANGAILGYGNLSFGTTINGSGTIQASGGDLDLISTASGGTISAVLSLATTSGTELELSVSGGGSTNAITEAGAVSITNSNQILKIDSGATLTLGSGAAENISAGTLVMNGGTLIDNRSGTSVALSNSGSITGAGTISSSGAGIAVSGGTVTATGGTLDLAAALTGTGGAFTIASNGVLQLGSTVAAGNIFTMGTATGGTIEWNKGSVTTATIAGLNVGNSPSTPTNDIIVQGTSTSGEVLLGTSITSATVTLVTGATLTLSGITNTTGTNTVFLDWVGNSGNNTTEFFLSDQACYVSGTRILTPTGERMVDSLQVGDIVSTLANGTFDARPVKWIGRRRLDLTAHPRPDTVAPIRIHRGAFAEATPHTDLLVSPDHAILVDGALICARQLLNGTTIRQEPGWTSVEYFHIELDRHAILLAEGLPAESYLDTGNRGFFANSGAPLVLHPDLTNETEYPARESASCAPFVFGEDHVRPVWQRLADRAAALGQPVPQRTTTTDPDLHLVVKGRTVRALYGENGLYVFALPKGATDVRMVSRASAPSDAKPWLEDRRRLGVYVSRMVLRGASQLHELPVDHPALSKGWWAVEQDGAALRRWTNGDTVLTLPAFEHPAMLEIHATTSGMQYVLDAEAARRAA